MITAGLEAPVLIFVETKEQAKLLFKQLANEGISCDAIHADRTQEQRDRTVQAFREGKIWFLIATELMGRGIDFKFVKLLINYDVPQSAVAYIHRIGRTGRAGRRGRAITFFTEQDVERIRPVVRVMQASGYVIPDFVLQVIERQTHKHKPRPKRAGKRAAKKTELKSRSKKARLKLQ